MQSDGVIEGKSAPESTVSGTHTETLLPAGGAARRLSRLFALLSVLAVAAILILAGYGIYRVYSHEMTRMAEATAIHVGESIFEQERATLLQWDGRSSAVAVRPEDFAGLDLRMKKFLRTFNMHKIKVFSAGKSIVYSTDAKVIGEVEADNVALDGVLAKGSVVSKLEFKNTVRDFNGEDRFSVDVVETYLPIRIDNFIVGAFEMYTDISATRDRVRRAMAYTLAVLAAVLVAVFAALYTPMHIGMARLRKAEERLRDLASVDGLTGVFNRRHVLDQIGAERERMLRAGGEEAAGCMALLMVDIDHFKRVNDTHGHLVGDEVLRATTSRLSAALRTYDFIGRYGGEEFLVALPGTDLAGGLLVAERMRACICDAPVRCGGVTLQVSISVGVATTLNADEQTTEILKRADAGLYKAKEGGRNRVCSVQS